MLHLHWHVILSILILFRVAKNLDYGRRKPFAILMWYGRTRAAVETRRAIALALLVQDAIGAIASIEIQLKGSINAFGWSSPILYVLLALGYAWFVFFRSADC